MVLHKNSDLPCQATQTETLIFSDNILRILTGSSIDSKNLSATQNGLEVSSVLQICGKLFNENAFVQEAICLITATVNCDSIESGTVHCLIRLQHASKYPVPPILQLVAQ